MIERIMERTGRTFSTEGITTRPKEWKYPVITETGIAKRNVTLRIAN